MLGEQLSAAPAWQVEGLNQPILPDTGTDKRSTSKRIAENIKVVIRPSNSSLRRTETLAGYCKNFSKTGYGAIVDFAPRVGDIYRLELPSNPTHPINGVHARCVRCHLVDEDAFDCGFCFLSSVEVQATPSPASRNTDPLA